MSASEDGLSRRSVRLDGRRALFAPMLVMLAERQARRGLLPDCACERCKDEGRSAASSFRVSWTVVSSWFAPRPRSAALCTSCTTSLAEQQGDGIEDVTIEGVVMS
jgi:hypothetical protein